MWATHSEHCKGAPNLIVVCWQALFRQNLLVRLPAGGEGPHSDLPTQHRTLVQQWHAHTHTHTAYLRTYIHVQYMCIVIVQRQFFLQCAVQASNTE